MIPDFNPSQQLADHEKIAVNGFSQVLELLRVADPQFRESLLKRLASRDLTLAHSLRRDLRDDQDQEWR